MPTAAATPQSGEVTYTYDGDGRGLCTPERSERGKLVKSIIGSVTTYYPGAHYEKRVAGQTESIFKYYFAGSTRIAIPQGDAAQCAKIAP